MHDSTTFKNTSKQTAPKAAQSSTASTVEAATRLNESMKSLLKNYASLIKFYVEDGTDLFAKQLVQGITGYVFLIMGWGLFVVASLFFVEPFISLWSALLFWAAFHAVVGGFILLNLRKNSSEVKKKKVVVEDEKLPPPLSIVERDPLYGGAFVP